MLTDVNQIILRGNRIIIQEVKKEVVSNGIILNGKDEQSAFLFSEVVNVGPDVTSVKSGDIIMHSIRTSSLVRIKGVYFAIITEPEIVATINIEEEVEDKPKKAKK